MLTQIEYIKLPENFAALVNLCGDKKAHAYVEALSNNLAVPGRNGEQNPLAACSAESLFGCVKAAAMLDLRLDGVLGQAFIVAYKGNCQFQIGWKGMKAILKRVYGKTLTTLEVDEIYEGEFKGFYTDQDLKIRCKIDVTERSINKKSKAVAGFWARCIISDSVTELFMSMEEMQIHGQAYSKTFNNPFGVWKQNFNAMAIKTMYRMLINKIGLDEDELLKIAYTYDQAELSNMDKPRYIDNESDAPTVFKFDHQQKSDLKPFLDSLMAKHKDLIVYANEQYVIQKMSMNGMQEMYYVSMNHIFAESKAFFKSSLSTSELQMFDLILHAILSKWIVMEIDEFVNEIIYLGVAKPAHKNFLPTIWNDVWNNEKQSKRKLFFEAIRPLLIGKVRYR